MKINIWGGEITPSNTRKGRIYSLLTMLGLVGLVAISATLIIALLFSQWVANSWRLTVPVLIAVLAIALRQTYGAKREKQHDERH